MVGDRGAGMVVVGNCRKHPAQRKSAKKYNAKRFTARKLIAKIVLLKKIAQPQK